MGFASNVKPCFIQPTVVAVNESLLHQARYSARVMTDRDFFIGDEAFMRSRSSNNYNITHPIKHGKDHYFLLTESPLTLLLRIENIWVKSCLRHLITRVLVDVGNGATHILPVADGYVIGSSIKSIPIAGKYGTLITYN
ncbi:hypothetical protein CXB51_031255 [Gossypium anomalum]|uniref:Uncharacterized protein n=1 Tax=Gossypium anomalum TaxID=47600 RepID=A0A8J5Y855_9ROSI|nr:hypothetical protein CXB51_031255 [Gossypium anomalum]